MRTVKVNGCDRLATEITNVKASDPVAMYLKIHERVGDRQDPLERVVHADVAAGWVDELAIDAEGDVMYDTALDGPVIARRHGIFEFDFSDVDDGLIIEQLHQQDDSQSPTTPGVIGAKE